MNRKETRKVKVGNIYVGGDFRVSIQSMTNTDTKDVEATVKQIRELQEAGCDIVRCAVLDMDAACAIKDIVAKINIPLVADIHFDYRLALKAIENGVSAIRINPGNIGSREKVEAVVKACKEKNIPIRIGVNSGSLSKELLAKYGKPTPDALVESALEHVKILEELDFHDIVISMKSSNVETMIESYRIASQKTNYPLHLGVTEIDLINIAKEVEERLSSCKKNIKVAVMGCVVNGPGEAREADIGIAGGKGEGLIFRKGEIIKKVKEEDLVEELIKIIETI